MKNNKIRIIKMAAALLVFVIGGALIFHAGVARGASSAVPGSVSDPLITKSYLDSRLSEIGAGNGTAASFRQVLLSKGEAIVAQAGCEVMLYSGNAEISEGSLVNMTSGELFKNGNSVLRYHLHLAAEKGTKITAAGNVTLFVRGEYTK